MYVGVVIGIFVISNEFGRFVIGNVLIWFGIWFILMIIGGRGWGGWCWSGIVDFILRG